MVARWVSFGINPHLGYMGEYTEQAVASQLSVGGVVLIILQPYLDLDSPSFAPDEIGCEDSPGASEVDTVLGSPLLGTFLVVGSDQLFQPGPFDFHVFEVWKELRRNEA